MIKQILALVCFLLWSQQGFSIIRVLNGGGGLKNHGGFMTYYSARIPIQEEALDTNQIPGMDFLLRQISGMNISADSKDKLLGALFPSETRRYYQVEKGQISSHARQKLIAEYSKTLKLSGKNVSIFAMTNSETHETLLLPEFFEIASESEKAAILFRETTLLQKSLPTYQELTESLQSTKSFFDNPSASTDYYGFFLRISRFVADPRVLLLASVDFDKNLVFPWTLKTDQVPSGILLFPLFGDASLRCYFKLEALGPGVLRTCDQKLFAQIKLISQQFPQSLLAKSLLEYLKLGNTLHFRVGRFQVPNCQVGYHGPFICNGPNFPFLDESVFSPFIQRLYLKTDETRVGNVFLLDLIGDDASMLNDSTLSF